MRSLIGLMNEAILLIDKKAWVKVWHFVEKEHHSSLWEQREDSRNYSLKFELVTKKGTRSYKSVEVLLPGVLELSKLNTPSIMLINSLSQNLKISSIFKINFSWDSKTRLLNL